MLSSSTAVNRDQSGEAIGSAGLHCLYSPAPLTSSRIVIAGVPIDNLTTAEAIEAIERLIKHREPRFVVTPNVDHIVRLQTQGDFRDAYQDASLVVADGMPIIWLSRLVRTPLKEKVSGSDLFPILCRRAAEAGHRVYFMGGRPGAAQMAAAVLKKANPDLQLVGIDCPSVGFERNLRANNLVIRRIRDARPDVLFVGLGTPKGEIWIHKYHAECKVPVTIGIGGSFDLVAGFIRRAPRFMQRMGMEWLWRLILEPRRLSRRYLVDDLTFIRLAWQQIRGLGEACGLNQRIQHGGH